MSGGGKRFSLFCRFSTSAASDFLSNQTKRLYFENKTKNGGEESPAIGALITLLNEKVGWVTDGMSLDETHGSMTLPLTHNCQIKGKIYGFWLAVSE